MTKQFDVVIVGAGPAGIGIGTILKGLGVKRLIVLERHAIGASFERWPKEMRFISPSFTTNFFGQLDLNAVVPATSPAFTLRTEHPSGKEYARYLQLVAEFYKTPVKTGVDVKAIQPTKEQFEIQTTDGLYRSRFVVWAAGEFQYPNLNGFKGAELCRHNSRVGSWKDIRGNRIGIIGGYESGVDAAVNLVELGKKVFLLDRGPSSEQKTSDPSRLLSPYTFQRLQKIQKSGRFELLSESEVTEVIKDKNQYAIRIRGRKKPIVVDAAPILGIGFKSSLVLVKNLFDWHADGYPLLNAHDESTQTQGLYLAGPQVRHDKLIFCFIYKFRLRFGVVAKSIGEKLGLDTAWLEPLRKDGLYLDDLSCCGDECSC